MIWGYNVDFRRVYLFRDFGLGIILGDCGVGVFIIFGEV